jgi:hypothetical protein
MMRLKSIQTSTQLKMKKFLHMKVNRSVRILSVEFTKENTIMQTLPLKS